MCCDTVLQKPAKIRAVKYVFSLMYWQGQSSLFLLQCPRMVLAEINSVFPTWAAEVLVGMYC